MKILIINPPHLAIGSRMPREHLPPLGLLAIGGPLIDAGHDVRLLDAEFGPMSYRDIVDSVIIHRPDAVLLGHSGSTSAQPIINEITKMIHDILPAIKIIIGGIFPTYHWSEILEKNRQVDYIVCGEGEEITLNLINALERNENVETIRGLAFRLNGVPVKTPPAPNIHDLDQYRVGWELMNGYHYTYWGKRKSGGDTILQGMSLSMHLLRPELVLEKVEAP
jgi:anaerobic magnesium-protoporphyrin IX monomethyl ester cyclase